MARREPRRLLVQPTLTLAVGVHIQEYEGNAKGLISSFVDRFRPDFDEIMQNIEIELELNKPFL